MDKQSLDTLRRLIYMIIVGEASPRISSTCQLLHQDFHKPILWNCIAVSTPLSQMGDQQDWTDEPYTGTTAPSTAKRRFAIHVATFQGCHHACLLLLACTCQTIRSKLLNSRASARRCSLEPRNKPLQFLANLKRHRLVQGCSLSERLRFYESQILDILQASTT